MMTKNSAAAVLRGRGWLAATPSAFQDALIARADLMLLDAGQSLYRTGDDTGGLFGLAVGRLDIHLTTLGNPDTLAFVGQPGMWVGDIAVVSGGPRLMTIVSNTPCQVLRLPRAELVRIVEAMPLAWLHIAEMLAQNFARAVEMIDYLRCPDPVRRVAALLISVTGNRTPEPIRMSQVEMAEMTHLGRTNVQIALMALADAGLLRRGYASVEIVDLPALRAFAQSGED